MQNTVEARNLKKLIPIALFWWVMTKKVKEKSRSNIFGSLWGGQKWLIFKDFSFGTRQNFVGFFHSPLWCSGEAVDRFTIMEPGSTPSSGKKFLLKKFFRFFKLTKMILNLRMIDFFFFLIIKMLYLQARVHFPYTSFTKIVACCFSVYLCMPASLFWCFFFGPAQPPRRGVSERGGTKISRGD